MEDPPREPRDASAAQLGHPSERRDVRRAIEYWQRNTWGNDCIPLLDTFDFSSMRGSWGYRFLVCGGLAAEDAVFVTYGLNFAQLLGLPERAATTIPFVEQIPLRYREMFAEGYRKTSIEWEPVTLNGTISNGSTFEFFRAIFLPIMLQTHWSKQLIFGSFNYRADGPA